MITEQEILGLVVINDFGYNALVRVKISNEIIEFISNKAVIIFVPASFILKYGKPIAGINTTVDIVPDISMPIVGKNAKIKNCYLQDFKVKDYSIN